jgi:hypothetical protein
MQTAPANGQQRVALQRDGARGRARGEPMEIAQHNAGKVMVAKMSDPRVDARLAGEFRRHLLDLIESGHPLIALDLRPPQEA